MTFLDESLSSEIPEIVDNLPFSLDEVQYMKEKSSTIHFDSDDDHHVLDQYGRHSHPKPVCLLK
jgi:hypothetical protein